MKQLFVLLWLLLLAGSAFAAVTPLSIDGLSRSEALRLGERMYREGVLPSGEPMEAVVMGDIPVDGRMFTCDDCHQRSGLGSEEGTVITWPTNGRELAKPRRKTGAWRPPENEQARKDARKNLPPYWQIENARPAYSDETLAELLWTGVDPAGRKLDPIMPLYNLEDRDMAILIFYLNNLSVDLAPGVDDKTIYFATVVADNVPEKERQAMLLTLQTHLDAHNSQNRHQERRAASGPFYKTEMHQAYRRWQLDVWELHGPQETWPDQLKAYYQNRPVFALLGGIARGSWQPVHDFCEQNKIPAILPLTDFPVVSESDWYTLYFSKGVYQEGEAAARYLHSDKKIDPGARVVVLSRKNRETEALTGGFSSAWKKFNRPAPDFLELDPKENLTQDLWEQIMQPSPPAALILWLDGEDLARIDTFYQDKTMPGTIILSGELLDYSYGAVPEGLRDNACLTHRYSLPGENAKRYLVVERWLQTRKIPVTDLQIQSRMYFLGWVLAGAVKHMRSEFFREYFLEQFDMMTDQDYAIAAYPRLTFGPGQRYASKGCYIVKLTKGPEPELVRQSDWIIH